MCTVSFIAQEQGYLLGMNRDEQLTRAEGLPPKLRTVNGVEVIHPAEPGGGTWIALNQSGAALALINWYSITTRVEADPVSRGEVVKATCGADSPGKVESALDRLPLRQINPFRLIGVFPVSRAVMEWRWNLRRLEGLNCIWKTQQWISSGFDEAEAQRVRSRTFRQAKMQSTFGSTNWLRRLHSSHAPKCGPFSTCMHRADAATVSYTEVTVARRRGMMLYHSSAPCLVRFNRLPAGARTEIRLINPEA